MVRLSFVGGLAVFVGAIMLAATGVSAADMCFPVCGPFPNQNGTLFVAKRYKRPAPGSCSALSGYEASTPIPYPGTGMACLNAAGNTLHVSYSIPVRDTPGLPDHYQQVFVKTDYPYPTLTGGISTTLTADSYGGVPERCSDAGAAAALCHPYPLP
jgi:hypothetical protein